MWKTNLKHISPVCVCVCVCVSHRGAPPGLMLDVSRPQVRSAAACSLLRKMNDKAATVHAGTLARNALLSQSLGGGEWVVRAYVDET